jgi:hypothetical protein
MLARVCGHDLVSQLKCAALEKVQSEQGQAMNGIGMVEVSGCNLSAGSFPIELSMTPAHSQAQVRMSVRDIPAVMAQATPQW